MYIGRDFVVVAKCMSDAIVQDVVDVVTWEFDSHSYDIFEISFFWPPFVTR